MVPCGLVVLSGLGGDPAKNYKKERTGDKKKKMREGLVNSKFVCMDRGIRVGGKSRKREKERG